jgi:hypothetical protein
MVSPSQKSLRQIGQVYFSTKLRFLVIFYLVSFLFNVEVEFWIVSGIFVVVFLAECEFELELE